MPLELHSIDQFDFHKSPVYGICASGDDIYSVGGDRQFLHYWEENGIWLAEPIALLNHAGYSCYSIHDKLFAGDAQGHLYVFDRTEKSLIKIIQAHDGGIFRITHNGEEILSLGHDGKLNIWNISNLEMIRTIWISEQKLRDACWNMESSKLGIVGQDGQLRILHLPLFNELFTSIPLESGLTAITYWPEKEIWVTSSKIGKIQFWKENSIRPLFEFQAHKGNIYRILLDSQNGILWSASVDKSLKAWSLNDLTLLEKWGNLNGTPLRSVNDMAIFKENILICAGDNKKIDLSKICFSK